MTNNQLNNNNNKYEFIIIGGGIAGTTCAQRLCGLVESSNKRILLLSASSLVKAAVNKKQVTKFLLTFDIEEKQPSHFESNYENLTILHKNVSDLDSELKKIICSDNSIFFYDKLCICTGGSPKLIAKNNECILGIRDTETVFNFQKKLKNSRKVLIVGNGGIATELVYEIEDCDIIWAIKDEHISHMYFDAHSAKFFDKRLKEGKKSWNESEHSEENDENKLIFKRKKYTVTKFDMTSEENRNNVYGSALGPDWATNLPIKGNSSKERDVQIEYKCEIKKVYTRDEYLKENPNEAENWPVYAQLTNDKVYGVDFIISATGVTPSVDLFLKSNNKLKVADGGGLIVNDRMETSIRDIYAAGDCCTVGWDKSLYWFQMRLWSQASQMGDYVARSMYLSSIGQDKEIKLDFCFEMFAHITKFFDYKVILLGNYAAKDLGNDYELLIRCTEGVEYVKVVLHHGKVVGALLIGETDLEETFENLILNQIDVSQFGENLINPDIDIEDYFD